jgi:hypothetical protein
MEVLRRIGILRGEFIHELGTVKAAIRGRRELAYPILICLIYCKQDLET